MLRRRSKRLEDCGRSARRSGAPPRLRDSGRSARRSGAPERLEDSGRSARRLGASRRLEGLGLVACLAVWKDHRQHIAPEHVEHRLERHLVPEHLDHGRFVGSVMEGSTAGTAPRSGTPRSLERLPAGTAHRSVHRKVHLLGQHLVPGRFGHWRIRQLGQRIVGLCIGRVACWGGTSFRDVSILEDASVLGSVA